MAKYEGTVKAKKNYYVIRTPSRKNYFWGNYILIKNFEEFKCVKEWIDTYKNEFNNQNPHFMTFGIDSFDISDKLISEFEKYGFQLEKDKVLSCSKLIKPETSKIQININEIVNDDDWNVG